MQKGIDYIGNTIVFFCHDGQGNFLMHKRTNQCRDEYGRWDVGGGGIEFGQTIEENLRREIAEEYCTKVLDYEFLGYRDVHRERDGKKTHWIALDFKVLIDRNKVANGEPDKCEVLDWFRLDELSSPLHSQLLACFEMYKERLGL
jgi:ADP-ribose pyrophosphatase YjhB (NUDIX family)